MSALPREVWTSARIESAWSSFIAAPWKLRARANQRLVALYAVEALQALGLTVTRARDLVTAQLRRDGVGGSVRNLIRWAKAVDGAPRDVWLAVLLPGYRGCTTLSECDPRAWDWYKGHYLTRAQPSHASTYRRLQEMATAQGWTIPSAKTMKRRLDREVEAHTQGLMREGAQPDVLLPKGAPSRIRWMP